MPSRTSYGSAGEEGLEDKTCDWQSRGQPWYLMLQVLLHTGRQLLAISVVAYQVVGSSDQYMPCNRELIGNFAAVVCEYSKAHVRCFPLLAVIISLMIACRTYLFLHFFYRALRRDLLITFPPYAPYRDRVFQLLAFCASQACLHFILNMIYQDELTKNIKSDIAKEELRDRLDDLTVFYLAPAGLFFALLYASYDIGEAVLPFSKYFDDPEAALQSVRHLRIIPEQIAMNVLLKSLHDGKTTLHNADEALDEFAKRASKAMATEKAAKVQLSHWRMISTWWPGKLLLDTKWEDEESINFRIAWYFFSLPVPLILLFDLSLCAMMIRNKAESVSEGEYEDIAGLLVLLVCTGIVLKWTIEFSRKTILKPCLS